MLPVTMEEEGRGDRHAKALNARTDDQMPLPYTGGTKPEVHG